MNTITFLGGGVIFPLRPSQTAAQTWIIKHLLRFLHIFNNMHGTLIAARARIWIIPSLSTNDQLIILLNYHENEIPLANVIPGWEKSLSETEKWILANLFDWFVNQIIQRRKFLRCTSIHLPQNRIKIPPWQSFPPPWVPPWTASAPQPSPAPSVHRESSIKFSIEITTICLENISSRSAWATFPSPPSGQRDSASASASTSTSLPSSF